MHTVVETPSFIREAAEAGMSDGERSALVDSIAFKPVQGDEIRGSGGARKVRVRGRGKGKSGGFRVMVAYLGPNVPVYLLALLSKGERANFTRHEIAMMRATVEMIKRAGM
jgi:hypothetical protein